MQDKAFGVWEAHIGKGPVCKFYKPFVKLSVFFLPLLHLFPCSSHDRREVILIVSQKALEKKHDVQQLRKHRATVCRLRVSDKDTRSAESAGKGRDIYGLLIKITASWTWQGVSFPGSNASPVTLKSSRICHRVLPAVGLWFSCVWTQVFSEPTKHSAFCKGWHLAWWTGLIIQRSKKKTKFESNFRCVTQSVFSIISKSVFSVVCSVR